MQGGFGHKKAPALSRRGFSFQSMNSKRTDYLAPGAAGAAGPAAGPPGPRCPPLGAPLPQPGVVQTVTSWM
jgi:hypothetical protein